MSHALVQDWFAVTRPSPGVFALLEPLQVEQVLSYLITGTERALLIDTGMGVASMKTAVSALTDLPVTVVNSHSHWDHIGSNCEFDNLAIHRMEADELDHRFSRDEIAGFFAESELLGPLPPGRSIATISIGPSKPTRLLDGGERFELGNRTIAALHTPGHSPGLLCFVDEANGVLFSTDCAYPGPLYAYGDDTDLDAYVHSLTVLAEMAPELRYVHPSHNGDTMPPDYLPRMRAAMIDVASGCQPDAVDEWRAIHEFEGFGVFGPLAGERY